MQAKIVVKEIEKTCMAHPAQWEGRTTDGKEVYIRYRWGHFEARIDQTPVVSKDIGAFVDGKMPDGEMVSQLNGVFSFPDGAF